MTLYTFLIICFAYFIGAKLTFFTCALLKRYHVIGKGPEGFSAHDALMTSIGWPIALTLLLFERIAVLTDITWNYITGDKQ